MLCIFAWQGNKGSKTVELPEGKLTEIDIEVTADDGTIGHYIIKVKRLSSKDASLESLAVDKGKLSPEFDPSKDEYWGKCVSIVAFLGRLNKQATTKNLVKKLGSSPAQLKWY